MIIFSLPLACMLEVPGPDRVTVQAERIRELEAEVEHLETDNESLSDLAIELIEHGNEMDDPCGFLIRTGSTIFFMSHPLGQPETKGYQTWQIDGRSVTYTGERPIPKYIVEEREACNK